MFPHEARYIDAKFGWTPLHLVCHFGSSPFHLVGTIAAAYPKATSLRDRRFFDTPMHIQCRNSQRSLSKIQILLRHDVEGKAVLTRNRMGHTPVHTACGSNAMISVVKALVEKDSSVLQYADYQRETPLHMLWQTYIQSIPGHLQIARILNGNKSGIHGGNSGSDNTDSAAPARTNVFGRFWEKIEFIALASYKVNETKTEATRRGIHASTATQTDVASTSLPLDSITLPPPSMLGHALIQIRAPVRLLKLSFCLDPSVLLAQDALGNTMLHSVVEKCGLLPVRAQADLIQSMLKVNSDVASIENHQGEIPLQVAIERGCRWDSGLASVLAAHPAALATPNPKSGLVPFQTAAAYSDLDTLYRLLIAQPDALQYNEE